MLTFIPIDTLRQYEWSRDWHWSVYFPDGPVHFRDWFPATDVEENIGTINSYSFKAGLYNYNIPQNSDVHTISLTFLDGKALEIQAWLDDWMNEKMLNRSSGSSFVTTLAECVKELHIARYTGMDDQVYLASYWVYPNATLSLKGSSESGSSPNTIELSVCGRKKHDGSSFNSSASSKIR